MADLAAELLSLLHERGASDHEDRVAQLAELRRITTTALASAPTATAETSP